MIIGSLFTIIGFFSVYVANSWAWLIGCYFIVNVGAAGANVFYNSLLPSLAPSDMLVKFLQKGMHMDILVRPFIVSALFLYKEQVFILMIQL